MAKRSPIGEAKQRIRDKLKEINDQATVLHDIIDDIKNEANQCTQDLLQEKSKTKFFKEHQNINQKLEESLSQLFIIKNAAFASSEQGTETSDDEDYEDGEAEEECKGSADSLLSANSATSQNSAGVKKENVSDAEPIDKIGTCNTELKIKVASTKHSALPVDEKDDDIAEHLSSSPNPGTIPHQRSPQDFCSKKSNRKSSNSVLSSVMITKCLSDDIKVPMPIIEYDIAQTVAVTEIDNPWSFYIQILNDSYDQFIEEMCLHFSRQASQGYKGGIDDIPKIGSYCCAKSPVDSIWYRAVVKDVKKVEDTEVSDSFGSSTVAAEDALLSQFRVHVFMIDEGMEADVPIRHLRPLERQFSYLPCQAVHCMLAGVAPTQFNLDKKSSNEIRWPKESIEWFDCTIKSEHKFTTYIHELISKENKYAIDLYLDGQNDLEAPNSDWPSIDSNIGYMMLLVHLAAPYSFLRCHLDEHLFNIEPVYCNPADASDAMLGDSNRAEIAVNGASEDEVNSAAETTKEPAVTNDIRNEMFSDRNLEEIHFDGRKKDEENEPSARLLTQNTKNNDGANEALGASLGSFSDHKSNVTPTGNRHNNMTTTKVSPSRPVGLRSHSSLSTSDATEHSVEEHRQLAGTFENRYKEKDFKIGAEGFAQVLVSHVYDPSNFFVHLITPDVKLFDEMLEDLDRYYSNKVMKSPSSPLEIGNAVIAKFSEDGKWYRGIIKGIRKSERNAAEKRNLISESCNLEYQVLHVDFGSSEWVQSINIRPVVERFFDLPMETLPCSLADIKPMETSRDLGLASLATSAQSLKNTPMKLGAKMKTSTPQDHLSRSTSNNAINLDGSFTAFDNEPLLEMKNTKWSQTAITRFEALTLDGMPRIASLKENFASKRIAFEPWIIYLYNTNSDTEVYINQVLVDESLAMSNVYTKVKESRFDENGELRRNTNQQGGADAYSALSHDTPVSPTSPTNAMMDVWNPMKDEFLSARNAYTINTDDPGIATTGNAEPERKICKYYLSNRGCYRGNACQWEHSRPGDFSQKKLEVFCIKDQRVIPLPDVDRFVLVQVTSLISPVHFYVRFPYGTRPIEEILGKGCSFTQQSEDVDELADLQERMNEVYSKMVYRNAGLIPFNEGELIAAKYSEDDCWYRSQVLAELGEKYKVFFIDYGNTEIVEEKNTRKLLPEFLYLENQGVECFLANLEMKNSVAEVESLRIEAMNCFKDYLGDCIVIARVMSKAVNGTLYLELYYRETNVNINTMLLKTPYFITSNKILSKPWDMSKFIAVNTQIVHSIPG